MYDTSPFLPMAYNTNDYYMNYYSPREYFYQTGIEHMKRNILESDYRNYSFINSKIPSTNFQNTIKECHSKYHKRKDFTINSLLGLDAQLYARNTRTELDTGQKPSYDCSQNCVTSQLLDTQLYPSTTTNFSLSTSHEKVCNESTSQVPYQSPVWDEIRNEDACNEQNLAKTKRIRTIFTQEQLERLEQEFQLQQYIVGEQRTHLARSLNLSDNQVKIWYQNRRIKMRKKQFDSKCNPSETPNMLKSRVPDTFKSNFSMNSNPLLLSNNFLN